MNMDKRNDSHGERRIYTIATAHLDTVWNWDLEHTISVCLKNTLDDNFALFEKYPDYRFNFEGSYRYELFEEYYPEKFEKLKEYIQSGRWNPCGSCYENGDVNIPSPESLFRNILYGNNYFAEKFGKKSNDIFLPDCFGFGYALPSIARHANLKGISTQKLSWGSAYGQPFDIGIWNGPDGRGVFASIDSKSYRTVFDSVRAKEDLLAKLKNNMNYNLAWTLSYHGVGDKGGAPKEESVKTVCDENAQNNNSDIKVLISTPTEFFDDMAKREPSENSMLPTWNNELVMTNHGVGAYTSRAFSKRCNRRNEELADMAERAGVMAMSLSGAAYPRQNIEKAWKQTIAHTFHDDITGTSVQRVYKRSWNDYILSANRFSSIYEGCAGDVINNLDTSWVKGTAVVINNMLEQERTCTVDVILPLSSLPDSKYVRVFDSNGNELPSQVNKADDKHMYISICAHVPSLGFSVVDVQTCSKPCDLDTGLKVCGNVMENFKYIVTVNKNGDISSIIDKTLGNKELLAKPVRFELNKYKGNKEYPAWELTYNEVMKRPQSYARRERQGNVGATIVENGPARVTLKVVQKAGKSHFTYYVSLSCNGQWVNVYNEIEWREFQKTLHNIFSFTAKNQKTVFDLGLGAIERGVATENLYAFPAQKWADISDEEQNFGVSIFSDSKYGWIMKDDHTLRLTVLHSPKYFFRRDSVQGMLDFGLNRYSYAIFSHSGDFTNGTQFNARAFNQPMAAFIAGKHPGALGSTYSFGTISDKNVIIRALKKAENSDEIVVRVNEGGKCHAKNVELFLGNGITGVRELYASEEEIHETCETGETSDTCRAHESYASHIRDGKLIFSLTPYEVKTFALTLKQPGDFKSCARMGQRHLSLPYNADVLTFNNNRSACRIPSLDVSIPAEIFPDEIECRSIKFKTSNVRSGNNALIAAGQKIDVSGQYLYIIAASISGDKTYDFTLGDKTVSLNIQAINEPVACWDLYDLGQTAFIKTDRLAWECTHTHGRDKDNVAEHLYFFMYEIDIKNAHEIILPDDGNLIILAITESFSETERPAANLASVLYDTVERREFDYKMSRKEKRLYKKMMSILKDND